MDECSAVQMRPTAHTATFRIPHITHCSHINFSYFAFRKLPSALHKPQFRILPTVKKCTKPNTNPYLIHP